MLYLVVSIECLILVSSCECWLLFGVSRCTHILGHFYGPLSDLLGIKLLPDIFSRPGQRCPATLSLTDVRVSVSYAAVAS